MAVGRSFETVDESLIRLRRLWAGPMHQPAGSAGTVELSTVLVADAVHRLSATAPEDDVTVAAVAERLDVAASTASRLVERAVGAGVVRRSTSAADSRRVALVLTPSGTRLVQEARDVRRAFLDSVLAGWSRSDVTALADLLDRFSRAVHDALPVGTAPTPPQEVRR